jgi:hypothetical protein
MANLTRSERHNKMLHDTFEFYRKSEEAKKNNPPSCTEYDFFLNKSVEKLKISIDEAKSKYGQYTYGQWKELLNVW